MSARGKTLLFFIGPKGVGKTHIASVIEEKLEIPYFRVEKIWKALQYERSDFGSPGYVKEGMLRTLNGMAQALQDSPVISVDSTGTFGAFPIYLKAMQQLGVVRLINVVAPGAICLERALRRDQSEQVQMDAAAIEKLNAASAALELPWDLVLPNDPPLSDRKIVSRMKKLLEI